MIRERNSFIRTLLNQEHYIQNVLMVYAINSCGSPIKVCLDRRNMVSGVGMNEPTCPAIFTPDFRKLLNSNLPRSNILLKKELSFCASLFSSDWKRSLSYGKASSSNARTTLLQHMISRISKTVEEWLCSFILSLLFEEVFIRDFSTLHKSEGIVPCLFEWR